MKNKFYCLLFGMILTAVSQSAMSAAVHVVSVDSTLGWFSQQGKTVVTLIGYSGAGYEKPEEMMSEVSRILNKYDPKKTIINIGATPEGIGAAYEVAKKRGFTTTGIVSSLSQKYPGYSSFVSDVFVIQDSTWGGFLPGTKTLSPTSQAMVGVSNDVYVIGGGEVGRDEALAAKEAGKRVQFTPADMNHKLASDKATKRGLPAPTADQLKGAVYAVGDVLNAPTLAAATDPLGDVGKAGGAAGRAIADGVSGQREAGRDTKLPEFKK